VKKASCIATAAQFAGATTMAATTARVSLLGLYTHSSATFRNCKRIAFSYELVLVSIYASLVASAGSNGTNVFAASTAQFCLVMLVLNMFVKVASLYYFQHLHKTVAAELIGRAKQQPNRRASTNLALKQAHKEGGKGDVLLTPNSSTKQSSSGANYQNIVQQQQHHQQHHQHGIHDGHESDGSDSSFSMSPDRRQKASEA
jgi:hypothetical protein